MPVRLWLQAVWMIFRTKFFEIGTNWFLLRYMLRKWKDTL